MAVIKCRTCYRVFATLNHPIPKKCPICGGKEWAVRKDLNERDAPNVIVDTTGVA